MKGTLYYYHYVDGNVRLRETEKQSRNDNARDKKESEETLGDSNTKRCQECSDVITNNNNKFCSLKCKTIYSGISDS